MKTPFYLIDKYVYPALRRRLVIHLYKQGLSISEIMRRTGYSKSLISRYIKGERGSSIDISLYRDIDSQLEKLAQRIIKQKIDPLLLEAYLGKLAIYMMKNKYICWYHQEIDPVINPSKCNLCPEIFGGAP